MTISERVKFEGVLAYATGSTQRTSSIVDTKGYDGCQFAIHHSVIASTSVLTITVQGGHESDLSDAVTLTGVSATVADTQDDELTIVDVYRSRYRYLRLVVSKANSTSDESAIVCLYSPNVAPVTQPSTTTAASYHAPAGA